MKKRLNLYFLIGFCFITFQSNAQLDSVSVSGQFISPFDSTSTEENYELLVWLSDTSDLEQVDIYISSNVDSDPFQILTLTQSDFSNQVNFLNGNTLVIPISGLNSSESFTIKLNVQRLDLLYLPLAIIEHQ